MKELVEECLAGKHRDKNTITGKTVYDYYQSPYMVWCDYYAPPEEKDPVNKYLHLLSDRARGTKERIIEKKYKTEKEEFRTFTEGFKNAIKKCYQGEEAISSAPLFYLRRDLFGICDLLEKDVSNPSKFGAYHYTPVLIKSARRMKYAYMIQGAFYAYLLGLIQGFTPFTFKILNRDGKEHEYEYDKFHEELMGLISEIKEVQKGKQVSPTAKSCKWPWTSYCEKKAKEQNDVSIVPMIGLQQKKILNENGIFTVEQLAKTRKTIDIYNMERIQKHARAYVEQRPQVLEKPKLPEADVELYLDIEGTDELELEEGRVKVDFLVGVLEKNPKGEKYHAFIAKDLKDEKRMYKELFSFLNKHKGAPIYHYGPYEKMHLRLVAQQNGIKAELNLIDVLKIVKKCTAFPTISQSLKDIAGYLGYKWRGGTDAQEVIVLYLKYLETKDEKLLKRIVKYNEDDVRATKAVKEYLQTISL